jgi:hypothetical protein
VNFKNSMMNFTNCWAVNKKTDGGKTSRYSPFFVFVVLSLFTRHHTGQPFCLYRVSGTTNFQLLTIFLSAFFINNVQEKRWK